jgi:hypothetical protein
MRHMGLTLNVPQRDIPDGGLVGLGLTLYDAEGSPVPGMDVFPPAVTRLNTFSLGANIGMLVALYFITRLLGLFFIIVYARLRMI